MLEPRQRLPRDVRVVLLARTVNRLGAFSLPFLSLLLTRELGASLRVAGWLLSGFGVATLVSRLLGGRLADAVGRRTTILLGLTGCATAQLALAIAPSLGSAAVAALALGLAFEIYEPACQATLADAVPANQRASAFGLLNASLSLAALGAGVLAALLASHGLRLLFAADAVTCLLAAALLRRLLPVAHHRQHRDTGVGRSPWRDARLRFLFAGNVLFAACILQCFLVLPLTLRHRGLGPSTYGILLAVSAVVAIAAQPLLRTRLAPNRRRDAPPSRRAPIVAGHLVLAVGFAGYGQASTLTGFVIATAITAIGQALLAGHLLALVSELAPAGWRARHLAGFGLSWGVAATLAPIPAAWLLTVGGDRVLWRVVGGCCLTLGLVHAGRLGRVLGTRRTTH